MQPFKRRHRFYIITLPLLISYLIFFSACLNDSPRRIAPKAIKGVLDLSDWDLVNDGSLDLAGEWEFFWDRHLSPSDFAKEPSPGKTGFIQVPGHWRANEVDGTQHPADGFATYRLKVKLNGSEQPLALRMLEISVAYTLYINGKQIAALGVAGIDRNATVPRQMRQVVDFEALDNQVEIIMQVSNFHHRRGGGPWEIMRFGTEREIRKIHERNLSLDWFLFSSLFIMILYHLGLFLFRKKDPSPLYFSIFCFLIAARLFTTGGRYLADFFPDLSWELMIKLEYLTFYLAVPAFALFMHSLFPRFSERILRLIEGLTLVFAGIVVFAPARIFTYTVTPYQIMTILTIIYSLYVLIVSLKDRNIDALVFLFGFLILAMTVVNDILHVDEIIHTGLFAPFGFFFFVLSQAFLLSYRFSNAMSTVETQQKDLKHALKSLKGEIVERVQAEEALRGAHERFLTVLDSIDAHVYVSDMRTYEILFMNKHMRDTFGHNLVGQTCWRVFRQAAEPCSDCTNINLLDDQGKPTGVYVWEGRNPITEKWYINYDRAIKWVDNRLVRLKVATDVTELKQAEEALRESEEKYRTILQSIEEGYYEVDLAGNLTFFNDSMCRQLGYTREELMGMNNREFMSPQTAGRVFETFSSVYETGEPAKAFDWEMITKDGIKKYVELSVSLITDSQGRPTGYRGVGRDITERKKAEEQAKLHQQQLMQADKMVALGTLVSGVAHEINNPNNFIMLNSPILKEAWKNAMPILENYHKEHGDFLLGGMPFSEMRDNIPSLFTGISDGSKRIKGIVEDLRNYVRPNTADLTQPVEINAVIKSAVSLLTNMIKNSTHHFSITKGENLPLLKGNFQRLEQVIINLIQNACQALPNADRGIFITTANDNADSSIVVTIRDEGVGMSPDTLKLIMDPFFTTKQDAGGVGLGLSISSKIIEEHRGSLRFTSEPGAGTTATITLPLERENLTAKGNPE